MTSLYIIFLRLARAPPESQKTLHSCFHRLNSTPLWLVNWLWHEKSAECPFNILNFYKYSVYDADFSETLLFVYHCLNDIWKDYAFELPVSFMEKICLLLCTLCCIAYYVHHMFYGDIFPFAPTLWIPVRNANHTLSRTDWVEFNFSNHMSIHAAVTNRQVIWFPASFSFCRDGHSSVD